MMCGGDSAGGMTSSFTWLESVNSTMDEVKNLIVNQEVGPKHARCTPMPPNLEKLLCLCRHVLRRKADSLGCACKAWLHQSIPDCPALKGRYQ